MLYICLERRGAAKDWSGPTARGLADDDTLCSAGINYVNGNIIVRIIIICRLTDTTAPTIFSFHIPRGTVEILTTARGHSRHVIVRCPVCVVPNDYDKKMIKNTVLPEIRRTRPSRIS